MGMQENNGVYTGFMGFMMVSMGFIMVLMGFIVVSWDL